MFSRIAKLYLAKWLKNDFESIFGDTLASVSDAEFDIAITIAATTITVIMIVGTVTNRQRHGSLIGKLCNQRKT
jgi:hypothetical protein